MKRAAHREREYLKRRMALEKRKVLSEDDLLRLEKEFRHQDQKLTVLLKSGTSRLRQNNPDRARDFLTRAIDLEYRALANLEEMERIEEKCYTCLR